VLYLKYFSEEQKSYDICYDAINRNIYSFKYVPEYWKSDEICSLVLQSGIVELYFYLPQRIKILIEKYLKK
jgi:hypothetical protein